VQNETRRRTADVSKSSRPVSTCYMCDEPETSREHVPALCFFPEAKDLPSGVDLRRNLFTVPSCDAHNSQRSQDDQYLWQTMMMARGLNECARLMTRTKVVRTVARRPALVTSMMSTAYPAYEYDFHIGTWLPTALVTFDGARVKVALEHFACALYFWHFKARWIGPLRVLTNIARFSKDKADRRTMRVYREVIQRTEAAMAAQPRFAENQDAFYYQAVATPDGSGALILATFYGGGTVTCAFGTGQSEVPI
jgi:hypothetical protein